MPKRHAVRLPSGLAAAKEREEQSHWQLFLATLPYIWPEKGLRVKVHVVVSLILLLAGKACELMVPFLFAHTIERVSDVANGNAPAEMDVLAGPIVAYVSLRFATSFLQELRNIVFAYVLAHTERRVALESFTHLQELSLRFHLNRRTGAVIRSVSRGSSSFATISRILLFQIAPVFLQVGVVCIFLFVEYDWYFSVITLVTILGYFVFTATTTEWRNKFRRTMNEMDNQYNQKAVDALLNFETVKYFNAERHEQRRFDEALLQYQEANIVSNQSLALLNGGQSLVISLGILLCMLLAGRKVVDGEMSTGDFVLINQFILTLYLPLGFLGTYYRMIKQSFIDVENMFALMAEEVEITDAPEAVEVARTAGRGGNDVDNDQGQGGAAIEFRDVHFEYNEGEPILRGVSFKVAPGQSLAIVGTSGAGKSTIARLLYRFYDVSDGQILFNGVDVRKATQYSLRSHIAIVPQDCVLFNDTIGYNINYGRVGSSDDDVRVHGTYDHKAVVHASTLAQVHNFVTERTKEQYDTVVGERGLRLSGGEKQRVAIARAILKDPSCIVFDEATSSLDTATEQEIQLALDVVARGRSSITIAHRLSTIVNCDQIIVLKAGRVVESGTHNELLAKGDDGEYYGMWQRQLQNEQLKEQLAELERQESDTKTCE